MKFSTFCTITAAILLSASQTLALKTYLKKIPNGDSFEQALGHPDDDSSKYTDFAKAFSDAAITWTTDFCKAAFKTSDMTIDMTNGEAFGDPCCTWTVGATPDFTVTAFTISPTTKTVCASSSSATTSTSSSSTTPAATTATPAATTATPATTTATPATTTATPTVTTATPTVTTAAPVATTSTPTVTTVAPSKPSTKCNVATR